jgi:hypothetical protein
MFCLRGHDAGDGAEVFLGVYDLIKAGANGVVRLIGAHRDEYALCVRLEQGYGPLELRASVVGQRSFIALHTTAAATGQYEGVYGRRVGHGRTGAALFVGIRAI